MAGIYNRDNLGSQLSASLEAALARHQGTTDRQNARIASGIDAIGRGAEGITKDLFRDSYKRKLAALRAEREELDDEEDYARILGELGGEKDYMGEMADKLDDEWGNRKYDELVKKALMRG